MPELNVGLVRIRVREARNELVHEHSTEGELHASREVVSKRAVHEQVQLVLEVVDLLLREGTAPGRDAVCGEVVGAGVESAVDVVVGEVDVGDGFVETLGDGREVDVSPLDGGLYTKSQAEY